MSWSGLPSAVKGTTWPGLMHAADWLPTVVAAIDQGELKPKETLPLDGQNLWAALLSGGTSPRTVIYYGISEKGHGPAVRDVKGNKLITNGDGGGRGIWSPEQLPNASSFETRRVLLQQHKKNGAREQPAL